MAAVPMPPPIASSPTHPSPPPAAPLPTPSLASPPKRERNSPDTMLHDFHPLQPASALPSASAHHSPFAHHIPIPAHNYPSLHQPAAVQSQPHSQTSIQLPPAAVSSSHQSHHHDHSKPLPLHHHRNTSSALPTQPHPHPSNPHRPPLAQSASASASGSASVSGSHTPLSSTSNLPLSLQTQQQQQQQRNHQHHQQQPHTHQNHPQNHIHTHQQQQKQDTPHDQQQQHHQSHIPHHHHQQQPAQQQQQQQQQHQQQQQQQQQQSHAFQSQPLLHLHPPHHQPLQPPAQLHAQPSFPAQSFHLPQSHSSPTQTHLQSQSQPQSQPLQIQPQDARSQQIPPHQPSHALHPSFHQSHLPHLQHPPSQPHSQPQHLPTQQPHAHALPHHSQHQLLPSSLPQVLNPQSQQLPLPIPIPRQHPPSTNPQPSHTQPHHHPALRPAFTPSHFKHTDEVDVSDDLIGFATIPSSRPQDMSSALVNTPFPPDPLPASQDHSDMDSLLPPETEPDPLSINASLQMPLHMEPQRSPDRQVLTPSDPSSTMRPPLASQQNIIAPLSSTVQTPHQHPFSLHVPHSMAQISYGGAPSSVAHHQVMLQGQNAIPGFQLPMTQKQPLEGPPLLMLGRNDLRNSQQAQSLLQLSPQDELHRRGTVGSNQIRIQDLTKPKTELGVGETQFSPASPSYSAVTVSPPSLLHTSQASPGNLGGRLMNAAQSSGGSPTSITTPQGLSCDICKTVFTRRYNLKVHMTSKHSARRDYHCLQCSNAFNRGDSLKRHIATTHRGEKKWACTYCKRKFGQRPHMKMHIDTVHLKKRDHKCHCGKAFGTRYNLTAHQRTHQQTPKKHLCMVCKKSFALKSSLARHQRNAAHTNPEELQVSRTQNQR